MLAILTLRVSLARSGSGAARLEPLAGRPREIPNFPVREDVPRRADEDRSLERVWKHAVAEELAAFQIRVRGGEESSPTVPRARGIQGDRKDTWRSMLPSPGAPSRCVRAGLVLAISEGPSRPGLHLLREQRGQGRTLSVSVMQHEATTS